MGPPLQHPEAQESEAVGVGCSEKLEKPPPASQPGLQSACLITIFRIYEIEMWYHLQKPIIYIYIYIYHIYIIYIYIS
jgi:hypothetical protein